MKNFRVFGKMAWDWKMSSRDALRDYKSCEREDWSQRTPSIEELTEHQDLCGKHHQVATGPRGCNHQQHDHDWRTTSRRETASWEDSSWWVSLRGEIDVACQIESDIANMCAVIAWIWIVNAYCHDRFSGHMACSYCPDFVSFTTVVVYSQLTWLVCQLTWLFDFSSQ